MTDEVLNIINHFKKRKAKMLKELFETIEIKRSDPFKEYEQELQEKQNKTGTILDDLLGGGLGEGESLLLYGEFGAGKTQTCFTMSVLSPSKVVFLDTEGSFKWRRIKEICDARNLDYKEVFKKIILFRFKSWVAILKFLYEFPKHIPETDIGLIILDSLIKRFRGVEFAGRESLSIKQPLIREVLLSLEEIASAYGASLIITTQIYETPNANPFLPSWTGQKAVGGASLLHQPDYVCFLRKAEGNIRIARLLDSSYKPLGERPFIITKAGVEDIPEKEEKLLKKMEKKVKEYEKKHSIGEEDEGI